MIKKHSAYKFAPDAMLCSEEQAKKLKELGLLQQSFFQLWDDYDGYGYKTITHNDWNNGRSSTCSIYSDAELNAILPEGIYGCNTEDGYFSLGIEGPWCYKVDDKSAHPFKWEKWKSTAEAKAAIMIHLIEHGILDIEVVNFNLAQFYK